MMTFVMTKGQTGVWGGGVENGQLWMRSFIYGPKGESLALVSPRDSSEFQNENR